METPRIIIQVRGGIVTAINSTSRINAAVIDWDNASNGTTEDIDNAMSLSKEAQAMRYETAF